MDINFHFQKNASIKEVKKLKAYIRSIFTSEKGSLNQLDFIFCSDEYLLDINKQFLQHDYYTDIITFDNSEKGDPSITSEIYISVDRVTENAERFCTGFQNELHRIMFHGVLHLLGYGDKTSKQKNLMTLKEDYYLKGFIEI